MPSPMTISSAASASAPNLNYQSLHQSNALDPIIHRNNILTNTGLLHHPHTDRSDANSIITSNFQPINTSINHNLHLNPLHNHSNPQSRLPGAALHSNHGSIMSTLPSNYLSSHGHLLHEIYDISNKKPRIANHGFLMSDSPILSNQISNPQSLMCSSGHLSNLPTHIGNHQHGVNRANCFPNIHSSENTALSTASNNDSDSSRMPKNLRLSSSDFYVNNLDDNVEDGYNPHFEAISPTPNDESRVSPITSLKDQILSSIHGCDRQIQTYEALINVLKSKAQQLEAATSKHPTELEEKESQRISIQEPKTGTKQIYAANKIVADEIHKKVFSSMFVESPSCLPLYNQPSDLTIIHEVRAKFKAFQPKLIKRIKELKKQKQQRIQEESSIYDGLMKKWLKKIEDYENSPAKKARDAKLREYFEKQFTEMRKHREDRERMHRNDQRTRTDVEIEENDGCSSIEDSNITKMRNLIVIPPIMLSAEERQRNIRFNNQNGFLKDPVALYKMSKNINIWTESEREIFKVKYLMNPKKFGFISQHLERKSTADCVEYYYLSKKHVNYKQMLRKHVKKRTRAMIRAQQQQIHQQAQSNSPNNLQNQSHLRGSPSIQRLQIESATNLSFRPNPQSATSLILPYSLPISSTSSTIILTIPSKTSTAGSCLQIVNKSSTIEEIPNSGSAGINSSDVFSENPCDTGDASSDHNKKIYSGASLSNNLTTSTDDSIKCLVCGDQIIFGNTDPSNALDCESSNTSNNSNEINKRICLRCHLKKNIKRQCPILSCNAPKKKAKSLKVLPQQWIEMSIEIKKDLADELKIPIDAKIGCACCVMRINRRIGLFNKHRKNNQSDSISINTANSSNNRPKNAIGDSLKEEIRKTWSDSDIEKLRNLIKNYGKDWAAISLQFNSSKSSKDCSRLFSFFKNELKLLNALKEHYSQIGRQYDPETDDEGMSSAEVSGDETTSSLDEINNNESDTASASSSVGCRQTEPDNEERSNLQDYKPLSLSQGSLKSDYDSSATMSADESSNTNENSAGLENRSNSFSFSTSRSNQLGQNADENDPIKNSLYSTNGSSFSNHYNREKQIMFDAPQVPHFLINPNAPSVLTNQISQSQQQQHSKPSEPETTEACKPTIIKCKEEKSEMSSGTCVRDLIWKAIEKSLQIPSHNLNQGAQTSSTIDSNAPINLKRDTTQKNYPDTRLDFQPSLSASKSFVNKNKCDSIVDNIKPEGLVMNFPHNQYPAIKNEPDACDQVQDLSNKPRDRSRANEVMARNSPKETGKISKLESPYSTNLNKHSESFNHPLSFQRNYSVSTNYPIQPAHSNNISNRIPNLIDAFMPSQIPMESKAAHFRPNSQPLIKINSKSPQNSIPFSVSPKSETPLRDKLVQPMVGSITQGTPVVLQPASNQPSNMPFNNNKFPNTLSNAQSMLINSSSHHSGMMPFPSIPNYEIFRHMTNELPKGSITQGTPLIIGTNSNTLDITQSQLPQVIGNASIQSQNQSVNLRNKNPDNSDLCCPNKRIRFNEPNVTPNIIHHDMMERINKTHFEQSVPTQSHSIYHRPFSPNYMKHYNLPQNIKDSHFNQILIDFNTSKQMQSRRNSSSSDKEIVESSKPNPVVSHQDKSNRSLPHFQDPQSHSPSSSIYLQDRPGDKVLESQLLQWNNLNMGSIPNTGFLSRQNVIQHGYPVVSKNTSVIQSVPQTRLAESPRDEIITKNSYSPLITAHFTPENESLVNSAVHQPGVSVTNPNTPMSSIQSRLNKENFEKCFSESINRSPSRHSSSKPANSNRIVLPQFIPANDDMEAVTDLTTKSKDEKKRDSKQYHPNQEYVDLTKTSIRFPANSTIYPSESGKLFMDHKKKVIPLQPESHFPSVHNPNLSIDHRMRSSESLSSLNPILNSNPGFKFSREPFTSEHFESQLRQQIVENANRDVDISTKSQDLSCKSITNERNDSTMTEASKLFSQSFQKDSQPNVNSGGMTAANLIDAIITKQINTNSSKSSSYNDYIPSMNRIKQSVNNESPLVTSGLGTKFNIDERIDANIKHISKQSFQDSIYNMITENMQNSPVASPMSSSNSGSSRMKTSNLLEGIAAAAVASVPSTSSGENFKLRRALQTNEKTDRIPLDMTLDASVSNRTLIPSVSTTLASIPSTSSSIYTPLKTSNTKNIPQYMKPISPPNIPSNRLPAPHLQTQPSWTNLWPFMNPYYNSSGSTTNESKLPHLIVPTANPPLLQSSSSESHLASVHDSPFFISNRISEAMQRSAKSASEEYGDYVIKLRPDRPEDLKNKNVPIKEIKSINSEKENSMSMNKLEKTSMNCQNVTNDNKNSINEENISSSSIVFDSHKKNPEESLNCSGVERKNPKSGVIRLNNSKDNIQSIETSATIENNSNDLQLQYEPLSD